MAALNARLDASLRSIVSPKEASMSDSRWAESRWRRQRWLTAQPDGQQEQLMHTHQHVYSSSTKMAACRSVYIVPSTVQVAREMQALGPACHPGGNTLCLQGQLLHSKIHSWGKHMPAKQPSLTTTVATDAQPSCLRHGWQDSPLSNTQILHLIYYHTTYATVGMRRPIAWNMTQLLCS